MANEFKTECKDYGTRAGCHKEITMKKGAEGKWHPYNADGSVHKHLGKETPAKTIPQEVIGARAVEAWVRQLAREEAGKVLSEHGIGLKSE